MNFLSRNKKGRSRSGGRSHSADDSNSSSPSASLSVDDSIESILPQSWDLGESFRDSNLQLSYEGHDQTLVNIRNSSSMSRITVAANQPIPAAQLKKLAISRQSKGDPFSSITSSLSAAAQPLGQATRSTTTGMVGDLSNLFPSSRSTSPPPRAAGRAVSQGLYPSVMQSARNIDPLDGEKQEKILSKMTKDSLYYFEVSIQTLPAGCDASVGLVVDKVGASAGEFVPGETRDSIGLDSNGILRANAKVIEVEALQRDLMTNGCIEKFGEGDTVGCGVEITGLRRVFFTKNGRIIIPPTRFTDIDMKKTLHSPSFGVKVNRNQAALAKGNFGIEAKMPFVWTQWAYLAYKGATDGSALMSNSNSSGSQRPRDNHSQRDRALPRTPQQPFRVSRQKKPPNRQQSAPAAHQPPPPLNQGNAGPSHVENSPQRTTNVRPISERQSASLSPAAGWSSRPNRRPGQGEPPTIETGRHAPPDQPSARDSHRGGRPVIGQRAQRGLLDESTSDMASNMDRSSVSSNADDTYGDSRMHTSSVSHSESDWQSSGDRHDEGSGFMSANTSGRSSMEFTAISEDGGDCMDPFLLPESNHRPKNSPSSPDFPEEEEEKTSIDESFRRRQSNINGEALTPHEIEVMRDNVRTLRSVCRDETAVEASFLETLLDCCRGDQQAVRVALDKAMNGEDAEVDLMLLIEINDIVVDAVDLGEKTLLALRKKEEEAQPQQPQQPQAGAQKPSNTLDLDINGLIRKKDVFSLICILRAQSDQRLDAALALMEFARDGETPAEGGISLRDEIRSSGGMHSLLQVFRAKGTSYELRVVAGMAVAHVLPSFVESSASVGLKIMECLRFLSTSRPVSPNGVKISQQTMFKASAMGVTAFWMNALEPMLNVGGSAEVAATEKFDLQMISNNSSGLAAAGGIFDQGHQTLELQELLEMTVSLIVHIEKHAEASGGDDASMSMLRATVIGQVCAVDIARPIAVREGLLPILVDWIKSKDKDKIGPAVSALRYLTSIKDKYMAGWIHSQMVNEGALSEVVELAGDYNAGHDVRLSVAQILSSLCVAPHTRAAVVEANCMSYLITFLFDHNDPASEEVALYAGRAITQLAAGAITRASVFWWRRP